MRIKMEFPDDYWDLTHDIVVPGKLNDPDDFSTWDMEGGHNDHPKPKVSLNGSEPLDLPTLGKVIKKMVSAARQSGCGDYEYIDLSPEEGR
jgi:hypothetical protein